MNRDAHRTRTARFDLVALAAIALAVLVLYLQVRHHAWIEFDDREYLPDNAMVRDGLTLAGVQWAFTTLYMANWHPLTWLSHMLDVSLFGMDPGAHHLVNVLLHAVVGMLLYALGVRCTARRDASLLLALMFVVHPQHVESVAWLAERKDLLCATFYLLAVLAHFRWVRAPGPGRYALVVAAYALALLSKPMAVSLPVVLLLLDGWPLARVQRAPGAAPAWRQWLALGLEKAPLAAMSLASCVVTVIAQQRSDAVTDLGALGFAGRLGNSVLSYALYLRDFALPDRLGMFYPLRSMDLLREILPAALGLLVPSVLCWRWRRSRPWLLVGWCWFIVTLLPVIGLVHVGSQARADRYMYVPSMGLLLALCAQLAQLPAARLRPARLAASGIVLFWGVLCFMQIGYWARPELLYRRTADVTTDNVFAEIRLIDHLIGKGELEAATERTVLALQRHPERYETHMSMGNILMTRGDLAGAERWFRSALQIAPRLWHLLNNLGTVVHRQGRTEEGCRILWQAAAMAPESTLVQENLEIGRCRAQ